MLLGWVVLVLTVWVGVAAFNEPSPSRWALLATWPAVFGDLCLAFTLASWVRAWRNDGWGLLLAVALMLGAMLALTAAAAAMGHPVVRAGVWLAFELSMAAVLGVAATRRWAGRQAALPA